jgi:putative ABC transport system permease protein
LKRFDMDIRDILWLSFNDLSEKKVRTVLSIIMVMIGVASIVALTSLTAGISQQITSQLSSLGPTSIIITASGTTAFTPADIDNLATLQNVSSVTPILTGTGTLSINDNTTTVSIIGVSTQGLQTLLNNNSYDLYQGAIYTDTVAPLAILGNGVVFPTSTSIQNIQVGQTGTLSVGPARSATKYSIPVVGILNSVSLIIPINTGVIVSMPAAQVLLHKTSFNEILVKANSAAQVSNLATLITTIYGNRARVVDTQQLASTASSIIGSISLLFTAIAGISLMVAAIGIMNVMLMAVMERTHEIGIMKSIGFKSKNVLMVFLFQALIIGVLGGMCGLAGGAGASYLLGAVFAHASSSSAATTGAAAPSAGSSTYGGRGSYGGASGGAPTIVASSSRTTSSSSTISFTPVFTPSIIIEAMTIAIVVSVLSGIYPAWKASRMEPIEALRQL